MNRAFEGLAIVLGTLPLVLAMATLGGLGMHRQAPTWAIASSATLLVLLPPLVVASLLPRGRSVAYGLAGFVWGAGLLIALPVYFPGERADAMVTGLSLGHRDMADLARAFADSLPAEPVIAQPEDPVASSLIAKEPPLAAAPVLEHQIALPYEGDGRRMVVDLAIEHGSRTRELRLLLDTGATYTTLPRKLLEDMGVDIGPEAPEITLHTAAGDRTAHIVLVDRLWLGDLVMEGVAIATCDPCATDETAGLLGLNVTGGYNLNIDADRQEVIFSRRTDYSRHLDIKPFIDVSATISRLPGRVSVEVELENRSDRAVQSAQASIHCRDETWLVDIPPVPAGTIGTASRRLPTHAPCERYQVGLHAADW